jgi:hypothetical protein
VNPRILLFAAPREDQHLMSGIRHQTGMMTHHAFHAADDRLRRIMQQADPHRLGPDVFAGE